MPIYDLFRRSKYVSASLQMQRLEVCNTCPNLSRGICTGCGCLVILKTRLTTESCPFKRWS